MAQASDRASEGLEPPVAPSQSHSPARIRAGISWTYAASIVSTAAQWAILFLLARKGGPAALGTYALATAIVNPIFLLSNLQLREIQATDALGRFSFSTIWAVRILSTCIALLIVSCIAIFGQYEQYFGIALLLVALARSMEALSDSIHGQLHRLERLDWIARTTSSRTLVALILSGILYHITESLASVLASMAISSAFFLIAVDLRSLRRLTRDSTGSYFPRPRIVKGELVPLLRSAVPLGLVMLLVGLNANIPRYAIEAFLGREQLGVFAAMAQLLMAGSIVLRAPAQALSPRMARAAASGDHLSLRKDLGRLYLLAAFLTVGGTTLSAVAGSEILGLLYSERFAGHASVLTLLAAGSVFSFWASVTGYGLTAARIHGTQLPILATTTAVAASSAIVLVPRFELLGAALAQILAGFTQFVLGYLVLRSAWSPKGKKGELTTPS